MQAAARIWAIRPLWCEPRLAFGRLPHFVRAGARTREVTSSAQFKEPLVDALNRKRGPLWCEPRLTFGQPSHLVRAHARIWTTVPLWCEQRLAFGRPAHSNTSPHKKKVPVAGGVAYMEPAMGIAALPAATLLGFVASLLTPRKATGLSRPTGFDSPQRALTREKPPLPGASHTWSQRWESNP